MEKNIVYRGKKVVYEIQGQGHCLIFLHGFLENRSIWDNFVTILKHTFTCISIDLPGFGSTDVFSYNHTMEFMADTVKEVLDKENITVAVITGHSMGGYVSLSFAKKFPFLLKGMVMFHSQAAKDNAESVINRNRTIEIVKSNRQQFITGFVPTLFAEQNRTKFTNEIDKLRKISLRTSSQAIIAALAGMRDRQDSLKLLEQLSFPVFFVIGKQDSKIPIQKIVSQIILPKHAECMMLNDVGHMGFIEAPAQIFPALIHFYNRCLNNN